MLLRTFHMRSLSRRLVEGAVLVGMVFGRFTSVVDRMEPMPVSDTGVVRGFPVIAGFMVVRSQDLHLLINQ
jgi:hypothetical protein